MNKTYRLISAVGAIALAAASAAMLAADAPTTAPTTAPALETRTTPSGLTIIEVSRGDDSAKAGDTVVVNYTGRLKSTGAKFDSSYDRDQPFVFQLGAGKVIKGWDEGIAGMHVGDKRQLIIPPDLGYGAQGAGDSIPPNSTLVFDVELVGIKK